MLDYQHTFNTRGALYNRAMARCPAAREIERRLLVQRLDPAPGETIADAPAGGGYLAEALAAAGANVVCIEPAANFGAAIQRHFATHISPLHHLPLPNGGVDKLGSLAGLHHLPPDELRGFFSEACRALRPGGAIAVADVMIDSPVARFLNGPVDLWTETGHRGMFFRPGDLTRRLEAAGFTHVQEQYEHFDWVFPDHAAMTAFFHDLFGLVRASGIDVADAVQQHLGLTQSGENVCVPWSLIYAQGIKRNAPTDR